MPWRKSPQALIDLFDAALPAEPRVERRKMFGYPAAFANGNLFAGLHQESFILRLPEAARAKLRDEHGAAAFEPMPGRSMREYVVLPPAILADRQALATWLAESLGYAVALPPKTKASGREAQRKRPSRVT